MSKEQVAIPDRPNPFTNPGTFYGVESLHGDGHVNTDVFWRMAGLSIPLMDVPPFWKGVEEGVTAESALNS